MKLKGKKKILTQTSDTVYNVPRKTVQQQQTHTKNKILYKENNYWYVLCQAKEGKKRQNIAAIATDLTPKSLNVVVHGDHQKP